MIRALQVVLALGIAGLIGAVMVAGRITATPGGIVAGAPAASVSTTALTSEAAASATPVKSETAKSRNVGGGVVASPLLSEGPLERVASLPQPTPPTTADAEAAIPEKQFLRWRLVFNAIATSAGILQSGDMALILPGIDVVSADEICATVAGGYWPCGMVARTAFRNYLQGRALNCHLPEGGHDKAIVTECLLQGQDPAIWLVERGWARTSPDSPLAAIAEKAKATNRGIYGQPPAGVEVKVP